MRFSCIILLGLGGRSEGHVSNAHICPKLFPKIWNCTKSCGLQKYITDDGIEKIWKINKTRHK